MKRSSSECWINLVIWTQKFFAPATISWPVGRRKTGHLKSGCRFSPITKHSIVTIATGEWRSSITRPKTTLACGSNATTQPPFWIASPLCAVKVC
ncbi:unnamed protein product, partial [Mycena citricolor]